MRLMLPLLLRLRLQLQLLLLLLLLLYRISTEAMFDLDLTQLYVRVPRTMMSFCTKSRSRAQWHQQLNTAQPRPGVP